MVRLELDSQITGSKCQCLKIKGSQSLVLKVTDAAELLVVKVTGAQSYWLSKLLVIKFTGSLSHVFLKLLVLEATEARSHWSSKSLVIKVALKVTDSQSLVIKGTGSLIL